MPIEPLHMDQRIRDIDDPSLTGIVVDFDDDGGYYVRWDDESLNVDGPMWVAPHLLTAANR